MRFSITIIIATLVLVSCLNVGTKVSKNAPSTVLHPYPVPSNKFLLIGLSFSISPKGWIYFVKDTDPSIVLKVDPKNYDAPQQVIDLKEWLKGEEQANLKIDDIWVDYEDRLILAESTTGKILRISSDARKLENLADSYDGYRLAKIDGLTGDQNGDIYVGSPHTATLYKINSEAGKLTIINEDLVRSNDFAIDDGDRLVVAESAPDRLVVYDLNHTNDSTIGWNLVTFPHQSGSPISLDFIDQKFRYLAVLTGGGETIQIFDLLSGEMRRRIQLTDASMRIRCHDGWFYLQSDQGIDRRRIPQVFQ